MSHRYAAVKTVLSFSLLRASLDMIYTLNMHERNIFNVNLHPYKQQVLSYTEPLREFLSLTKISMVLEQRFKAEGKDV